MVWPIVVTNQCSAIIVPRCLENRSPCRGKADGTSGTASFSVNLYGEEDAFELAVYCRRKGLREFGMPTAYYEPVSSARGGTVVR